MTFHSRRLKSVGAAPEDRAPRGRASSADAALQTAAAAASGRGPSAPRPACRSKPKAINPRGFGGQSPPIAPITRGPTSPCSSRSLKPRSEIFQTQLLPARQFASKAERPAKSMPVRTSLRAPEETSSPVLPAQQAYTCSDAINMLLR